MNMQSFEPDDPNVLLKIQNSRKPDQVVYLILDKEKGQFRTEGLKSNFGVKDIRIIERDLLSALEEYAQVLTFLLETMSEAQNLRLPYAYQDEFELNGVRYTLYDEGDHKVLGHSQVPVQRP